MIYSRDLAYVQAVGFGALAENAAPEIVLRLRAAAIPVHHVIDAGCGAGPLTKELLAAGFGVTGIDLSADLLEFARQAAPAAGFIHGSLYDVALPACQGVIAIDEPLTYHDKVEYADAKVFDFFRRVADVLPSGGLFIFDLIETGEPPMNYRTFASGVDWTVTVEVAEDRDFRRLTREIQVFLRKDALFRRSEETHSIRLFDSNEVLSALSRDFQVETATHYGAAVMPPRRRAFFCTKK